MDQGNNGREGLIPGATEGNSQCLKGVGLKDLIYQEFPDNREEHWFWEQTTGMSLKPPPVSLLLAGVYPERLGLWVRTGRIEGWIRKHLGGSISLSMMPFFPEASMWCLSSGKHPSRLTLLFPRTSCRESCGLQAACGWIAAPPACSQLSSCSSGSWW